MAVQHVKCPQKTEDQFDSTIKITLDSHIVVQKNKREKQHIWTNREECILYLLLEDLWCHRMEIRSSVALWSQHVKQQDKIWQHVTVEQSCDPHVKRVPLTGSLKATLELNIKSNVLKYFLLWYLNLQLIVFELKGKHPNAWYLQIQANDRKQSIYTSLQQNTDNITGPMTWICVSTISCFSEKKNNNL